MNKVIGILAHVDAGKTTFAEGLLYHTNAIREKGRVDYKNSCLDNHELERERGITIFTGQAVLEYKGDTYYLLDTPGHVDFSPEMERAIMVMDYAVLIISAVEGVQGHTERVWQLLRKHKIPVFFFLNKTDRDGADLDKVLRDIRINLTDDVWYLTGKLDSDRDRIGLEAEEVAEFMAERDEEFLELYLEGKHTNKLYIRQMSKMIKERKLYLCQSGSALQDRGIAEFFDNLHLLTATSFSKEDFAGRVYKITYDKHGTRITFLKLLSGTIRVRDEITYDLSDEEMTEKITQIRIYSGNKYKAIDEAGPGQLIGVIGLSRTKAGQGLGIKDAEGTCDILPALKAKVMFDPSTNLKDLLRVFKILEEEEPSLKAAWDEQLQEIHIQVMGQIQLEVLEKIIKDRFGLTVRFGEPNIIYKETIKGGVTGYGHFEPLGHYAEVHLKIEAGKRNTGIQYENLCHSDDLSPGNQNLVKYHIFEKEHKGLLTGSPLTDLKITLLTGKAHKQHTSGGDFREATYRALRQGLEKADNIILEPYYNFKIQVEVDQIGRVISDIQKAKGTFSTPQTIGDKGIIEGRVPVATFMSYPAELAAFTGGKGMINFDFGGYDICHNPLEVIERAGYDKKADKEYTSSSIFCSKGQAYVVPWEEAEEKMHCSK